MQSRIPADTDIVFVMSTSMKTAVVTDWKAREKLDFLQMRVADYSLGTARAGEGLRFVKNLAPPW